MNMKRNIMKTKIFFICLFYCYVWQANAQTNNTIVNGNSSWATFDDSSMQTITQGKIWRYESGYTCPEGNEFCVFCYFGIETMKVRDPKTFNGKEYYELITDEFGYSPYGTVIAYVREEGKKIFFYAEECDKEYLMYDFDLNVGDEVFLRDPFHPTSFYDRGNCELTEVDSFQCKYKVLEVDSIEYNQVKRKRLKLSFSNGFPDLYDIWVEGIGCMRGIAYPNRLHCFGGEEQLKDCYESDELIFVNENPEHCWVTTSMNDVRQDLIYIFTDKNNILHIVNAKDIPLTIYNIQGQKIQSVFSDSAHYTTDLSFLPKGLYLLKVYDTNGRGSLYKFIKK